MLNILGKILITVFTSIILTCIAALFSEMQGKKKSELFAYIGIGQFTFCVILFIIIIWLQ